MWGRPPLRSPLDRRTPEPKGRGAGTGRRDEAPPPPGTEATGGSPTGCKVCERPACPQRSAPAIGRPLAVDEHTSTFVPYAALPGLRGRRAGAEFR
ncbi:short-chain fatty acyl-CoA regulator family protein [Kitasatospora sp. NPDC058063]|uniref:short-chain fatty acyl-CoA regulator family protein n=1 Tax=unclassified Kitasatospora TaxID=2633591 RepID=UPI0036DBCC07